MEYSQGDLRLLLWERHKRSRIFYKKKPENVL